MCSDLFVQRNAHKSKRIKAAAELLPPRLQVPQFFQLLIQKNSKWIPNEFKMDSKCADSCRSLKKSCREIFKSCMLVDFFQNWIPLTRMLPGLWSGEHSRRSCEQIFFCWWAPCLILYVVYYVLNIKERLLSDKVMRLTACTSLRWVVVFNVVSLFPCCCCSGKVTIVCLRLGLGCSAQWGGVWPMPGFFRQISGRHPACAEEVGRGGGGEDG